MVVEDVPGPGPARAGNVIVAPEAVGICGSDYHLFSGEVAALSGMREFYPRIQGHEVCAVIEDPGSARTFKAGDRVAVCPLLPCGGCYPCRIGRPNACVRFRLVGVHLDGGLAEHLEVPAANVFAVGDLDPDTAAFAEPASGVLPQAVELVSSAGRVVVVGMSSGTAPVRPGAFPEKEIDVTGSSCATADDFSKAIRLVSANRAPLAALFSHHFPLARAAEAFEFAMSRPQDAIKIVVRREFTTSPEGDR
jgi:threonine dehydrogenase-like Zn-dependent dehydrogenase